MSPLPNYRPRYPSNAHVRPPDQDLLRRATAALNDAEDSNQHVTLALVEELKLEAILMKGMA